MTDDQLPLEQRDALHDDATADPLTETAPFPWPPSDDGSVATAFVSTWHGATLRPAAFFRALPEHGSIGSTLLYYIPLGILIAGAELFWESVRSPAVEHDSVLSSLTVGQAMSPLVGFLLSPLILLISLFMSAGVTHVLLKLFGGAKRDFGFTTRIFAFAYSPMIFGVIPIVGTMAGFVWMLGVAIVGLREGHRTTTGRAAAAVLIPVVLALFFVAIALLITAAGAAVGIPL